MSKRLYANLFLVVALVIASCSGTPIIPNEWSTCYTYGGSNGWTTGYGQPINLIAGEINVGGNLQTVDGELILNWQEPFYVYPLGVEIAFGRVNTDAIEEPPIEIAFIANIFEFETGGSGTLPAEEWNATLQFINQNNELVSGRDVNATIQTDGGEIEILYLRVYVDDGENPFASNSCDQSGPTVAPTQPTNETPTITPTITNTPPAGNCFKLEWDFATQPGAWQIASGGQYVAGMGYRDKLYNTTAYLRERILHVKLPSAGTNPVVKEIGASYSSDPKTGATDIRVLYGASISGNIITQVANTTASLKWIGTRTTNEVHFYNKPMYYNNNPPEDRGGSITLQSMYIIGQGDAPATWATGATVTNTTCAELTPTPTATFTPTMSLTPSITPTATRTQIVITNQPTATATRTLIPTFTPFITWTSSPMPSTNTPIPATATRTNTPLPTVTNTPLPTMTPLPPTVTPMPTLPPPTLPPTATHTPPPASYTPDPFYTPEGTFTPQGTATPGGTPIPTYVFGGIPTAGFGGGTPVGFGTPGVYGTPGQVGYGTLVPTPDGTDVALPTSDNLGQYHDDVRNPLRTAVAEVNKLPNDIVNIAPNLDNLPTFAGYGKWIMSGISLQELVGRTLYPIFQHIFYALYILIFVTSVRVILRLIMLLVKFAAWVISRILDVIPF